ncbi:MAG: sirohydrochlorin cobaltochelatase [Campylobacterota bacterium]|nr:sirohydrochlorin cobaltochelatase [Campylobacterota bacterium]
MKRYRHYREDKAIVLSCFGSIIEQDKYLALKALIDEAFVDVDIFLSFSSRMILRNLHKKGMNYKNLTQVLADVDMLGYRNIIVSSINLFPTDEHEVLKSIVNGFRHFSLANIRYTDAILTKTKETTIFLKTLNEQVTIKDRANLYVMHGTPALELGGVESIRYSADLLEKLGISNYTCSLEGAFPFYAIKDQLIKKMFEDGVKKVQIIPMLLISGNHYIKDMVEIRDELAKYFVSSIVQSSSDSDRFNLIEQEMSKDIIINSIKEEIVKLGQ